MGEKTDTRLGLEGRGWDAGFQRGIQRAVLSRGAREERVQGQVEGRAAMEGQEERGHRLSFSGEQAQRIVGIVVGCIVEGPAQGLFGSVQGFSRRSDDERMQCGQAQHPVQEQAGVLIVVEEFDGVTVPGPLGQRLPE